MNALRETHAIMRTFTDLIRRIDKAGPDFARFVDPLLTIKLAAARVRHTVIISRGPHDGRRR